MATFMATSGWEPFFAPPQVSKGGAEARRYSRHQAHGPPVLPRFPGRGRPLVFSGPRRSGMTEEVPFSRGSQSRAQFLAALRAAAKRPSPTGATHTWDSDAP